ncbi:MAG: PIN domain-containing protein [Bryobacteraceae bacterium]
MAGRFLVDYPLRQHHANRLFELPLHHKDPFDRLIISTALSDDLPVISRDEQFRKYKGLRVVW